MIDEEPIDVTPDYGLPQFRTANLGWHIHAACLTVPTAVFFPEMGQNPKLAKQVCARCDVVQQCLDDALESGIRHGVWGGLSARERRGMIVARKKERKQ